MKTILWTVLVVLTFFVTPSVCAHEHREIAGKFVLIVGFVKEPAYAGEMNGVDVHVTTRDKKPIEGVEKTLHVTVLKEDKSIVLPLRSKYKEPGRYAGYFLPTKGGAYTFIFEGTINGTPVNEKFTTADGKFHEIEEPVQFP